MPAPFDPQLINDPFGDPGLFVDLTFERRALLFDLGDLARLAPRMLLRISDVFITHRHMDHFVGFDHLLRTLLGREKTLRVHGASGLIDAVAHKLSAYSFNLVAGYAGNLVLEVGELAQHRERRVARFSGCTAFARADAGSEVLDGDVVLREPGLEVRAATLDHGIPVLAFALQERAHINIWRNRVEARGLAVGPWLRIFKQAVLDGEPDERPIEVKWAPARQGPATLPLGELKQQIMRITSGRKIAYIVDVAFTEANVAKMVALAERADVLFIEARFLEAEAGDAQARHHLTATQAGTIARLARVKRLATLHYSPRYRGRGAELANEAEAAFRGSREPGEW
jgi:ribonuclease Z